MYMPRKCNFANPADRLSEAFGASPFDQTFCKTISADLRISWRISAIRMLKNLREQLALRGSEPTVSQDSGMRIRLANDRERQSIYRFV